MRSQIAVLLAGPFVLLGLVAGAEGRVDDALPEWKPEPAAVKKQAKAVEVFDYTIRLPKNYEGQQPTVNGALKTQMWFGPERADKSRPAFSIMRLEADPKLQQEIKISPLVKNANSAIGLIKRPRTNWKQDPIEKGTIDGLKFARTRCSWTNPKFNKDFRGIVYVGFDGDGKSVLLITAQDDPATADKTLPELEAAILTIKKK